MEWIRKYNKYPNPGIISFCIFNNNNILIDGQHRLETIRILADSQILFRFYASFYYVESLDEARHYYLSVNNFKTHGKFITNVETYQQKDLQLEIRRWLFATYPSIFSEVHTNRPWIKINKFLSSFNQSQWYNKCNTLDDFINIFNFINEEIKKQYNSGFLKKELSVNTNDAIISSGIYFRLFKDEFFTKIIINI